MIKATVFVLLSVASVTYGDYFTKRFSFQQVMVNCIGEEIYYNWLTTVVNAAKECHQMPMTWHKHSKAQQVDPQEQMVASLAELLKGDRPVILPLLINQDGQSPRLPFQIPYNLLNNRQKREVLYEAPLLKKMLKKAMAKVGNFTCVLEKLEMVDSDMNLRVDHMKKGIENLTEDPILNQDLTTIIDHCSDFSMCLPADDSPLPMEIKRAMAFMKCDKKMRMAICMKKDIRKYMEVFDVSELHMDTEDEDQMAEKLLHIFWGAEAKEDFEVY